MGPAPMRRILWIDVSLGMVREAMDKKGDGSGNRHSTPFNLPLQGWSNVESGKKVKSEKAKPKTNEILRFQVFPTLATA